MTASLPDLDRFDRETLRDRQARSFKSFRMTLTPRYFRVWTDIVVGYLALVLIFLGSSMADRYLPKAKPANVLLTAAAIGYVIAYIQLFLHEAAHYLLAPDHSLNDWLANAFVGLQVGQDVRAYRIVHLDHHRYLGCQQDTEHSYFDAPNAWFFIEALTGVKVIRVLMGRGLHLKKNMMEKNAPPQSKLPMLILGALFNASIVGLSVWAGYWSFAMAWPIGMVLVHPAINALRQLLEHRSFNAKSSIDYSRKPHGAVTRIFAGGPIGSTLGGAGFNRHLLHHWEPQISYTRLAELEAFLLESEAAGVIRRSKTTYARALTRLLRAS